MDKKTKNKKTKNKKGKDKKTLASIKGKQLLKNYLTYKAVWRTRAFRQFCQENRDRVTGELEAKIGEISQKPEEEREEFEQGWLEAPLEKAQNELLRSGFLETLKGKQVQSKLEVFEVQEQAIWYERHRKNLLGGQYLKLRINLTFPKERIGAEFEQLLMEMHPKVERPPTPPRSYGKMEPKEIEDMFRAFDLVEANLSKGETNWQSIKNAANTLYKKARAIRLGANPAEDWRYQQVLRWHAKVNEIIGDL